MRGVQIESSDRTLEATIATVDWNNPDGHQHDADAVEVSIWLDKKNKPDKKLGIALSKVLHFVNEGGKNTGQGRDIKLTIRHYLLQRVSLWKHFVLNPKYNLRAILSYNDGFFLNSGFENEC